MSVIVFFKEMNMWSKKSNSLKDSIIGHFRLQNIVVLNWRDSVLLTG